MPTNLPLTPTDLPHLRQCLALAAEALHAGDEPFGSVLVGTDGTVLAQARNRVNELNSLAHPELALAQWAAAHLAPDARAAATLYTSGEHCPMCATAHGWVGLGKIVYLASAQQLTHWLQEIGVPPGPVHMLPVQQLLADAQVAGPAEGELLQAIRALHVSYHTRPKTA
ncbi:nucleoside deaminase (plasmid) [Hymenobacter sp. NBH84]|uniref:Nucleoside deaminase n=1 Tax=Hymenobacter citatus TaxID=2763506 RepID=A0ABR7MQ65_9BACT|nr:MULTISPECIES: nucleoside deaminase [Hymenobacter]MBC6613226.1 nucleoside deaminase [Hymenobacter citatus]QNE41922.1 nucleoside deaminase [Hymenobacter sp. NBH84]